jgi:hypothetical protein
MKHILAEGLDLRLPAIPIRLRNKHRDQLIAALSNLAPRLIHPQLDAKMFKRPAPGLGMQ